MNDDSTEVLNIWNNAFNTLNSIYWQLYE